MGRLAAAASVAALLLAAGAGSAAARPADVNVVNGIANPVPVSITGVPQVRAVPDYYRVGGSLSVGGTFGSCTPSLFSGIPAGRTFVLTNVEVDASDTIRPEFIIWLRQQTGAGFFTHFLGVPLTQFAVNSEFSGTLVLNDRVSPGGSAAGDISDVFVCLAPGAGDSSTTGRYLLSGYLDGTGSASASIVSKGQSFRPRAESSG